MPIDRQHGLAIHGLIEQFRRKEPALATSLGQVQDVVNDLWRELSNLIDQIEQLSAGDLTNGTTGSGSVVLSNSPTLVTPTIASFTNAQHNHTNAAGGGVLVAGAAGDIQTNSGAGGFAALASTGTGNAVRENSPTINAPTLNGLNSLAGAGGASGLIRSHPTLALIEFGSLDSSDVIFITNATEEVRFIVGGGVKFANLPNADPGAGSKEIWYDPGDGNRVKYTP